MASSRSLSSGPTGRGTRVRGKRVLAIILAGGKGKRLGVLTQERAKPTLTFAGTYRLIDFALSNCVHSGLSDVWVIEEYELHTLNDHLANGRPWDLDRTHGGLQVLPPFSAGGEEGGFAAGNADALYIHRGLIRQYAPEVLLVLSADHVYTLDYRPVIEAHLNSGAAVTMVTTALPEGEDASRFGVVQVDEDGAVTHFAYKPEHPRSQTITTEIFVYDAPKLLAQLDALHGAKGEQGRLGDFGDELIPAFVAAGEARATDLGGYWLDVGLPGAYWRAHQDLLRGEAVTLDDPEWPILTSSIPRMPARLDAGAQVEGSLVSYGCRVAGTVRGSVLAPGVIVEEGATVEDSVLLRDVVVRAGTQVRRAIVDEEAHLAANVGGGQELTVVGARARVNKPVKGGAEVQAGPEM
ncbi:glucose-1-phosphate adenylyltransferase family protein [Deinococcus multiflagellatus]|uniref:Glucose-1-phosphate adenylyltransferase family protein n=1 Tax=Deinococcus multiflagellatus TaxID=1656887 RepID=A0ABW1ZSX5_9DEIO|nr:sugar phosphate nucleotidyltransferase [Deinococcus multiflagellatus]MBZ9715039.1 NTP transferase domain-containing protein [Deinococcus multiflagellatus]